MKHKVENDEMVEMHLVQVTNQHHGDDYDELDDVEPIDDMFQ